jgi:hypothetical protein
VVATPVSALTDALFADLDDAASTVDRSLGDLLDADDEDALDLTEWSEVWDGLDQIIQRLRSSQAVVRSRIAQFKPFDALILPGGNALKFNKGKDRKAWDHARIAGVVIEKIIQEARDPDTGAMTVPPSQLLLRVLDFAHVDYWKKKPCAGVGVTVDNYCDSTPGELTIQAVR